MNETQPPKQIKWSVAEKNQKVMNRLHGRRQDKVDYFMQKNYNKMSTLERDNALHTLEKQADQLDHLGQIKQKMDEAIEEKKVVPQPKKVQ